MMLERLKAENEALKSQLKENETKLKENETKLKENETKLKENEAEICKLRALNDWYIEQLKLKIKEKADFHQKNQMKISFLFLTCLMKQKQ